MRRLLTIFGLLFCAANAGAQTTTFNGVVKDLTNTPVPTGQVTFTLKPGIDTTISGSSRFVPATTFCEIHNPGVVSTSGTGTITVVVDTAQNWLAGDSLIFVGTGDATLNANSVASPYVITVRNSSTSFVFTQSGAHVNGAAGTVGGLYKSGGTGACAVMQNTAITPQATSYTVGIQAIFAQPSSFNTYAIGAGPIDISTVVPTPSQMPAYSFVDTFSTQSIAGWKTFTGPFTVNTSSSANNSISLLNPGTFTNLAMDVHIQSMLNGATANQFHTAGQVGFATEAFSAGAIVPAGVTVQNINGFGAYISDACDSRVLGVDRSGCTGVGFYADALATGNHAAVWGINTVCHDANGVTNANITCAEFDIGSNNSPLFVQGVAVISKGAGTAPLGSEYFLAHHEPSAGTFSPTYGFLVDRGAVPTVGGLGIVLDGLNLTNSTPSSSIAFKAYDGGGTPHVASVLADLNGNLILQPSAGAATSISNNAGVSTPAVTSQTANPSTTGFLQLANTDKIAWRNAGNTANHAMGEYQTTRGTAGCATAASIAATCTTVITWPSAFADTSYTVSCVGGGAFTGTPILQGVSAKAAATVTIQTMALTAAASSFASIDCSAEHD